MLSEYIVAERKATRANADWGPVEVRPFRPAQAAGVRDTGPSNKLDDYRPAYPSDLTDSKWRAIEPLIPPATSGGRPSKYERRDIVNAILYQLRTGCSWRSMPEDLPPWKIVHHYYRVWREDGSWEPILAGLVGTFDAGSGPPPRLATDLVWSRTSS